MKKIRLIFMFFIMMMLMACTGKEPIEGDDDEKEVKKEKEDIRFSDEYLVGFDYGGSSWGEFYECISARVIICTNKDVLIYMPTSESVHTNSRELELIDTLTLTGKQYENIEKGINRKKLYWMKIRSDDSVCDGSSYFLILYDKNEEILKACGAYEPKSKKFWEMYSAVLDNVPTEEIMTIRNEYVEKLRNADMPQSSVNDTNDEEIKYDQDMLDRMFNERYSSPFYCELDHIDDEGNFVYHLYEAVDNGDEQHTATIEWYTINPYTGDVSTFLDDRFNIEDVLDGTVRLAGSDE